MDIHSRPEFEDLVRYDVECTIDLQADKYVEHAVSLLHAHEKWFTEHRAEKPVEV